MYREIRIEIGADLREIAQSLEMLEIRVILEICFIVEQRESKAVPPERFGPSHCEESLPRVRMPFPIPS
jgi:hypothetical protein